ncbi:helix-turn-helix domain-containing protein [Streptomyces guryensis]|uniref:LysR family transcriptional regulator n=1 Tax=Streptomyces guryensis TaxID=2886947 RepID=A0A9Q3VW90_9ACTN|nr:LysR family transcriptional regulator [Streptomyces guryensis]MCD9879571.1 LysR family transcriptional regulator [Streptomyces guryensis]
MEESFTRAAARCHVARSAISRQSPSLERELGEALFEWDSSRMRLTAAGEALVPHARAVAGVVAAAKPECAARSGLLTGTLSLGVADGVESSSPSPAPVSPSRSRCPWPATTTMPSPG